jgi:hypothetical protein
MDDREHRIREIAHSIWEEEGHPEGQAERHWRMAQTIVEREEAERKTSEGEPPGETPAEYVTPLAALKRASSSSEGAG